MGYEKIDGVPVMTNEFAVLLDSGDIVAVGISRSVSGSRMVFRGMARAINSDGSERFGHNNVPIRSEISYSDPRTSQADAIARDCILALLGETPELIKWSEQFLLDVSIRQAISVSSLVENTFDPSQLI